MQEFWIETCFIENHINDLNVNTAAVKILLPKECTICSFKIEISNTGCENSSGLLKDNCPHTSFYSQLYKMKIEKIHNPINDGCKCEKCTEWVPMANPNLPNNKFKCYRCRTHPLST